jgi:hypothetical protein
MSADEKWLASSCRDLAMADRQLLAKCGVVVLLGLNVGAYYLFWPKNNGRPIERAATTPASAPAAPIPPRPKDFPVTAVKNAEPHRIVGVDAWKEKVIEGDDAVNRLVELIQKDNAQPIPVVGDGLETLPRIPAPPLAVADPKPHVLPPLKGEPINDEANGATDPNVAIASALAQRSQQSPWLMNVKKSGTQIRISATLRRASPAKLSAEFEILCDRVDVQAADGLHALGSVTFVGAGIKGGCQRLTVPWNAANLVFEEQVRIMPEDTRGWSLPGSQLRGERFVWEQAPNDVDVNAAEFRPAGLLLPRPPMPGDPATPK